MRTLGGLVVLAVLAVGGCSSGGGLGDDAAEEFGEALGESLSEGRDGEGGNAPGGVADGRFVGTVTVNLPDSTAIELVETVEDEVAIVISDGQVVEVAFTARYTYRTCRETDGSLTCTIDSRNTGEMTGGPIDLSSGSSVVTVHVRGTASCEGPAFDCKDIEERESGDATLNLTVSGNRVTGSVVFEGFELYTLEATRT